MAKDSLHRYLFDDAPVRGELVQVSESFQQLTESKDYPPAVKNLLGELMVATSLMTATLKFEGNITVQIQGDGLVSLAVINGNNQQVLRGTARWKDAPKDDATLLEMMGKGQIIITIEPDQGERYQGIVPLEKETLEACLEDYFVRSEQLKTQLWLRSGELDGKATAAGMLLQIMPDKEDDKESFEHLAQLTATIKNEELFGLSAQEILYRLYHQENVKVYPEQPIKFECSCSRERSAAAISAIPRDEVEEMLSKDGDITLHCDYCGKDYHFDRVDIAAIFDQNSASSKTIH